MLPVTTVLSVVRMPVPAVSASTPSIPAMFRSPGFWRRIGSAAAMIAASVPAGKPALGRASVFQLSTRKPPLKRSQSTGVYSSWLNQPRFL